MKETVSKVIAAVVGAALFAVIDTFVAIPSFIIRGTDLAIQYGFLAFFSTLFGPVVGFFIGFVGHTLTYHYSNVWWPWVISSGVFGLLTGLGCKYINLKKGSFGLKKCLHFNAIQAAANALCFALLAPALEFLLYHDNARTDFSQGAVAAFSNFVTTLIVGSLLCLSYSMILAQGRYYEKLKSGNG